MESLEGDEASGMAEWCLGRCSADVSYRLSGAVLMRWDMCHNHGVDQNLTTTTINMGNAPNIQASQLHDKETSNTNTITSHNISRTPNNIYKYDSYQHRNITPNIITTI